MQGVAASGSPSASGASGIAGSSTSEAAAASGRAVTAVVDVNDAVGRVLILPAHAEVSGSQDRVDIGHALTAFAGGRFGKPLRQSGTFSGQKSQVRL